MGLVLVIKHQASQTIVFLRIFVRAMLDSLHKEERIIIAKEYVFIAD